MDALAEKRAALAEKQKESAAIYEEAKTEGDQGPTYDFTKVKAYANHTTAQVLDDLRVKNTELEALADEVKQLDELHGLGAKNQERNDLLNKPREGAQHQSGGDSRPEEKTMGQLFLESKAYKQFQDNGVLNQKAELDIDLKTVFRTGAGWATEAVRMPRVELDPQRPIMVVDRIPQLRTGLDTIRYMEETTFTNNATELAEQTATTAADAIGEAALVLTERTQPVEWLPVFIPVTMQQLEDVEGIEDYVNARLTYMIQARLDSQILSGDGSTPNLLGTVNVSGINTQAKGTDPTPDAIFKGMRAVRAVGFAEPSAVFVHPNDWEGVRLLRTADGHYIFGSPDAPDNGRIWGIGVTQTTAATENTILLGDYRNYSALYTKRGMTLAASDSHSFYFTRGLLAIRADMRISMVHFRPEAFSEITGV